MPAGAETATVIAAGLGSVRHSPARTTRAFDANDDGPRDKWCRILREDGFEVDQATGMVRLGRVRAQLTDHALNTLPYPQPIHYFTGSTTASKRILGSR